MDSVSCETEENLHCKLQFVTSVLFENWKACMERRVASDGNELGEDNVQVQ